MVQPPRTGFASQSARRGPGSDDWDTEYHVSRWQAGDNDAAAPLIERYDPLLAARLRRLPSWPMLSRHMEPQDVLQEAWVRFLKDCKDRFECRGKGAFLALLRQVFDNTAASLAREQNTQKRGQGDRGGELPIDGASRVQPRPSQAPMESPTSALRTTEIAEIARERLEPLEHQVWDRIAVQGYTAPEVALELSESEECMEKSAEAIRGIYLRARAKLAERL